MRRLLLLLAFLTGCAAPSEMNSEGLRVGVAEVDITPPLGYRMAGYYHERKNTGTKDKLKAKAIVLAQGETKIALVFCDLIGVPASVSTKARERASSMTGIPAANISIAATHSHTGPLYYGIMHKILVDRSGPADFDYPSMLVDRIAGTIVNAESGLRPVQLEAGSAQESRLSFNRRYLLKDGTVRTNPGSLNPEIVKQMGPIDPEVSILLVQRPAGDDGRQRFHTNEAALTVFACHCDTVGGTEYSADYPFFIEKGLRAKWGDGFVSLFGAGTCGNINHIDVTTKERRKAEEIGATLAKDVEAAALSPVHPELAARSVRLNVPVQRVTAEQIADARRKLNQVGSKDLPFLEQVRAVTTLHLAELPDTWPLEVQVFRLGPEAAIVTLPGEIFVEHGLAIKKASPFKTTFVIELANDNCAYVPTREAYAQGAYEVMNSRLQPGGGEMMVEAAIRMLKELAP